MNTGKNSYTQSLKILKSQYGIPEDTLMTILSSNDHSLTKSKIFLDRLLSYNDDLKFLMEREEVFLDYIESEVGSIMGKKELCTSKNKNLSYRKMSFMEKIEKIQHVKSYILEGKELLENGEMRKARDVFHKGEKMIFFFLHSQTSNKDSSKEQNFMDQIQAALDYLKLQIYTALSLIYKGERKHTEALKYLRKLEELFRSKNNFKELSLIYNDAGLIYKELKDYKRAEKFYFKSLSALDALMKRINVNISDDINSQKSIIQMKEIQSKVLNNLGVLNFNNGKFKEALLCLQNAFNIRKSLRDYKGQANTLTNIASVMIIGFSKYQSAIDLYKVACFMYQKLRNIRYEISTKLCKIHALKELAIENEKNNLNTYKRHGKINIIKSSSLGNNSYSNLILKELKETLHLQRKMYIQKKSTQKLSKFTQMGYEKMIERTIKEICEIFNKRDITKVFYLQPKKEESEIYNYITLLHKFYDVGFYLQAFQILEFIKKDKKSFLITYPLNKMIVYISEIGNYIFLFVIDKINATNVEELESAPKVLYTKKIPHFNINKEVENYGLLYKKLFTPDDVLAYFKRSESFLLIISGNLHQINFHRLFFQRDLSMESNEIDDFDYSFNFVIDRYNFQTFFSMEYLQKVQIQSNMQLAQKEMILIVLSVNEKIKTKERLSHVTKSSKVKGYLFHIVEIEIFLTFMKFLNTLYKRKVVFIEMNGFDKYSQQNESKILQFLVEKNKNINLLIMHIKDKSSLNDEYLKSLFKNGVVSSVAICTFDIEKDMVGRDLLTHFLKFYCEGELPIVAHKKAIQMMIQKSKKLNKHPSLWDLRIYSIE